VTLAPLLSASPVIQLHAFAATAAFALGIVQLARPKGTLPHRTIGWIWVVLMLVVSATAFFIHEIRLWGPWSPIHLLAVFTLIMLPLAVARARRHEVARHRRTMIALFFGALVVAGAFTFLPGRIMHDVIFTRKSSSLEGQFPTFSVPIGYDIADLSITGSGNRIDGEVQVSGCVGLLGRRQAWLRPQPSDLALA
jgi:uncharacterized membrane protein